MVGKNFFNAYVKNYEEKWFKKIRDKGKYSLLHFDGALKGLLREVSLTNPTAIEGMTPYPLGDIKVEEFSDYVIGDSIMWGGIPGPYFTNIISDKKFKEFVLKVIETMVKEPRYILGIGDQIPPDGHINRIEMVSELVEKYGLY